MADHTRLHKHIVTHLRSFPLLGRGAFGEVYEATGPKGEKYALKISSLSNATKKEEGYLLAEVTTLARFSHPHIVKYVSGWEDRDGKGKLHMYLLMELCCGRDLRSFLMQQGASKGDVQFGSWLAQIASGLNHIHNQNVIHRNLKTSNIMVVKKGQEVVLKIGDFGMSRILDRPGAFTTSVVGTPYFMSPESLRGENYNYKTDIWSFGCTAFEIATRRTIFQAETMKTLMSDVNRGLVSVIRKNVNYDLLFVTLMTQMLDTEACNRPDAIDILRYLAERGYTSLCPTDLSSSVSSTGSITKKSTLSQRSRLSPKVLPSVPEMESLPSDDSCVIPESPNSRPDPNKKSSRSRSHSESDLANMESVLLKFSIDQRKRKTMKEVTFKNQSTDIISSTDESDASAMSTGRSDECSGSGYEADISASGTSSVSLITPRSIPSDYGTDEEDPAAKSGQILVNITKFQKKVSQAVGKDKFVKAYEVLGIEDESAMLRKLEKVLGDQFDDVGPSMIYLRLLETKLDSHQTQRTGTGSRMNRTM